MTGVDDGACAGEEGKDDQDRTINRDLSPIVLPACLGDRHPPSCLAAQFGPTIALLGNLPSFPIGG